MENYTEYQTFLADYAGFLEQVAAQESEKYASLLSYDHKRMDKAIAAQQAMNMRLEKYEARRAALQTAAGLGELSFREILPLTEGAARESMQALFTRIEKCVLDIKYLNGKSLSFVKEGMQLLGTVGEQGGASYTLTKGKTAEKSEQSVSLFETKI